MRDGQEALVVPFDVFCQVKSCDGAEDWRESLRCEPLVADAGGGDAADAGGADAGDAIPVARRRTGCGRISYVEEAGRFQADYDADSGELVGYAEWSDSGGVGIEGEWEPCFAHALQTGEVEPCPDATVEICYRR